MNHTIATNATSESARAGASTASIARAIGDGTWATASRGGRGASSSPAPHVPAKSALPTAIAAPPTGSDAISASTPSTGSASASARLRASPGDPGRRWPVEALTGAV